MRHPDLSTQLLVCLREGVNERQYVRMCRLYRRWLYSAEPGDVERLISQCPTELLNNLLVLLRDLLMHFPRAVLGIPCLVQHSWSDTLDGDLFEADNIALPEASSEIKDVAPGIEFIGWAMPGSTFTSTGRQPVLDAVSVVPCAAVGAIALFKATDEYLVYGDSMTSDDDDQGLCISDFWWARLMAEVPGNLMLQTHRLMPYPEAVEAARIMCDTAGVELFDTDRPNFARQLDIEEAKDKARHFNRLKAQL
ncbi:MULTISPECIES: hypothetical protein [unclassified Caballeronia]|uniref:hypothetical protein n=1 Tax=unclassified Caballeronia TaxID=2646786 RepID=UPI0020293C16|nr:MULTISPECIES: hypothetical protein [unclassified Caballeronia]